MCLFCTSAARQIPWRQGLRSLRYLLPVPRPAPDTWWALSTHLLKEWADGQWMYWPVTGQTTGLALCFTCPQETAMERQNQDFKWPRHGGTCLTSHHTDRRLRHLETSGTRASFQQGHFQEKTLKPPLPGHKEVQPVLNQTQGQNRTDSTLGNNRKQMNHQTNKVFCRYKLKNPRLPSRRLDGSLLGARIRVRHGRHVSTKAETFP